MHPLKATPMKKLLVTFTTVTIFIAAFAHDASAGAASFRATKQVVSSDFPYEKGAMEIQAMAGAYWSLNNFGGQPTINYALENVRLGWMVCSPIGSGCLRGNGEVLLGVFGSEVVTGPGNYMIGGELIFRYNFVQPGAKWVPYVQLGGGGLYNNIYKNQAQNLIGGPGEFMLTAGFGVRYHLSEKWALSAEFGYRHISNADIYDRNLGLNSLGGQIGVSRFF